MRKSLRNLIVKAEEMEVFQSLVKTYTSLLKSELPKITEIQEADNYTDTCLYNYLERFLFGWLSIYKILPDLMISQGFNYPVGILARSIIIDCITTKYLTDKIEIKENDELEISKFLTECKKLDYDFVKAKRQLFNEFGYSKEKLQAILKEEHEGIKHIYPSFYSIQNGEYTLNKGFNTLTIKDMANEQQQGFGRIPYLIFKVFSQYEHCSFFTKDIQNNFNTANFSFLIDTLLYTALSSGEMANIIGLENLSQEMKNISNTVTKFKIEMVENLKND